MGCAWGLLVGVAAILVTQPGVREGAAATEVILRSDDTRDLMWGRGTSEAQSRSEERLPLAPPPPPLPPTAAPTPPRHALTTNTTTTPPVTQGEKGLMGRKVDDVLAALVGLSENPTFWRFVHSVVAELDITQRIHPTRPPSTNHHAHGYWLRTAPGHLSKTSNNKENLWDMGHKERVDGFLTTTPLPSYLPWPHLISEDQYTPDSKSWTPETQSATSSQDFQTDSLKTPTTTTQAPHFLFHRVIVDTGYDSHTRQPYRRPVLALTAVDVEKAKASGTQNAPMNSQNATSFSMQGSSNGRESQYEYEAVTVSQQVSSIPRNNKLESVKNKQEGESVEYDEGNESRSKLKKHHNHRSSHKVHRLYTFESQLRYLQRWEARLWRRSHFKPHKWSHSRSHIKL